MKLTVVIVTLILMTLVDEGATWGSWRAPRIRYPRMTYQTYFMEKKSSFKLKTKINKILTLIFTCVSVAHISIQ
jgi:hypothetical protein